MRRDTPLQEKWNGSKIERDDERRGLRFRCFEVSRIRERFFFFETRIKMDNQLRRVTPAEIESMRANYLRVYADNRDKRASREHTIAHLRKHCTAVRSREIRAEMRRENVCDTHKHTQANQTHVQANTRQSV